jgi:hypothetical protein
MRKSGRGTVAALAVVVVIGMATAAGAAVTVKQLPTASFSGASVTVTGGNFSGLGNIPAFANLTVTGLATYECQNPQGHASPGQNPVEAEPGSSGPVNLGNSDHNGRGTISSITASVSAPATPSAQEVGCGGTGSTKWSVVLTGLTATAAQLVVTQDGVQLFCWNYTFGGPATGTPC